MKPWEDEETIKRMRRMSGARSVELGSQLIEASLEIFKDSIRNEKPHISKKQLKEEVRKILWQIRI